MRKKLLALGLAAGLAACGRCSGSAVDAPSDASTDGILASDAAEASTPGPSRALAGSADVHLRSGAADTVLRPAEVARTPDGLVVQLTAQPLPCPAPISAPRPYLSFEVPRGPGGAYFATQTLGAEMFVALADAGPDQLVGSHRATITIDDAITRDAGPARLGGTLRIAGGDAGSVSGTFSADVCERTDDGDTAEAPLPSVAPATPLAITYREQRVESTTSVIALEGADEGVPRLGALLVTFRTPSALVGEQLEPAVELTMTVTLLGACAESQRALFATPQPVRIALGGRGNKAGHRGRGLPRPAWGGEGKGWVQLSRVELRAAGRVEGKLVFAIDGALGGSGGGSFVATVR